MTTFGCDDFHEIAPDLALGLLAGDERGVAINHVAACARCRRHLEALVQVTDDLLLLAPSVEPEIGFESRVMARLADAGAFSLPAPPLEASLAIEPALVGGSRPAPLDDPRTGAPAAPSPAGPQRGGWSRPGGRRRSGSPVPVGRQHSGSPLPVGRRQDGPPSFGPQRRWPRPLAATVAAALIVVTGVAGLATGLTRGRDAGRDSALRQQAQAANQLAARTVVVRADGGRSTCQLVAFPGAGAQPARLVVHLDEPGEPPASYQVLAERAHGGPAVEVGEITLIDGHGTLTAAIPAGTGPVDAVRIMEGPAVVKYRATFKSV